MNWNHSNIERLIHLYSQQPALWDPIDNNYHIKTKKNDAWELIASQMGCESEEVKFKMTSLLSSYRREKIKIKKWLHTGKGRDPKWFAFKYFEFLRNRDKPTNSVKIENYFGYEETSQQLSEDVFEEQNEFTNAVRSTSDDSTNTPAPAKKGVESSKRDIYFPKNPVKKKKKRDDQRLADAYNMLESASNMPLDECTTFGEHIVTKLRKFGERQRSLLMHRINNLIFEAEMELYSREHIYTSSSSSASSPSCSAPQL